MPCAGIVPENVYGVVNVASEYQPPNVNELSTPAGRTVGAAPLPLMSAWYSTVSVVTRLPLW